MSTETELLKDKAQLRELLCLANARVVGLERACFAAGHELRELQAKQRKHEVTKLAVCWVGLWVLAGVVTWVAI